MLDEWSRVWASILTHWPTLLPHARGQWSPFILFVITCFQKGQIVGMGEWNGEQCGAAVFELGNKDRWAKPGEAFARRCMLSFASSFGLFFFLSLCNFLYYLHFLAFHYSPRIWAGKPLQPEFLCQRERYKKRKHVICKSQLRVVQVLVIFQAGNEQSITMSLTHCCHYTPADLQSIIVKIRLYVCVCVQ